MENAPTRVLSSSFPHSVQSEIEVLQSIYLDELLVDGREDG